MGNEKRLNLNGYLLVNLILVGLLLVSQWRGDGMFDGTIRLSGVFLLLVVINTVLIFRESLFRSGSGRKTFRGGRYDSLAGLRQVLANREEIDESLFADALAALAERTSDSAQLLYLFEEGGHFSVLASSGQVPAQLSGARFIAGDNQLKIRHPGGLGDESICRWPTLTPCLSFVSGVTRLHLQIVPVQTIGNQRGLWVGIPTEERDRSRKNHGARADMAIYLEGLMALVMTHSRAEGGRFVDMRTGLLRYDGFHQAFDTEIERSERYGQQMTLMQLSLPRFDELPAPAREALPRGVAAALRESLRRLDLMFLWETPGVFAAILTETSPETARMVAERVLTALRKQLQGQKGCEGLAIQVHVGTATYPGDASHGDGLLEKAGEALSIAVRENLAVVAYGTLSQPASATQGGDKRCS